MANISMTCHPDTPAKLVDSVEIIVERQRDGRIWVRYHVEVPEEAIVLARAAEPDRTDGLWQTTCFEAFVRHADAPSYFEFNFAPSSQWAAYSFAGYRDGMTKLLLSAIPEIGLNASASHFALEAISELPAELRDATVELAIAAVIEETDGTKSYWALKHPPGAPDFHHRDCFALQLEAPGGA